MHLLRYVFAFSYVCIGVLVLAGCKDVNRAVSPGTPKAAEEPLTLERALRDLNSPDPQTVILALSNIRINYRSAKAIEPMARKLNDPDVRVRDVAARTLRDFADTGSPQLRAQMRERAGEAIEASLEDSWEPVVSTGMVTLGFLNCEEARPKIEVFLKSDNPNLRSSAQSALRLMDMPR